MLFPEGGGQNTDKGTISKIKIRVAPDTELAGYPANFFAGYPTE